LQRFLLCIPGGVFGAEGEETLLSVLEVENELEQYDIINRCVISSLLAVVDYTFCSCFISLW